MVQLCYPSWWTPLKRGKALYDDIVRMSDFPPRLIEIEDGDYDLDMLRLRFPRDCESRGQSRRGVRISCAAKFLQEFPCTWELDYNSIVSRMTLISTAGPKDQVCPIGFRQMKSENDKPLGGEMHELNVIGKSWCFYFWSVPAGNTCKIYDCYGEAANCVLGACKSSGATAQFIDAYNSTFVCKPELSDQGGAVTNPVYGGSVITACRGGRTRLFGCMLEGKGENTAPRLVGVTDWFDSGSQHTKVELHNTHIRLTPGNGEKEWFDLDMRLSQILVTGGSGTDPLGKYVLSPTTAMNRY